MPLLRSPDQIRALLETDRPWSLYPLGDLSPALFDRCEWFAPADGRPALVLIVRAFDLPVLFTLGEPEAVRPLLAEAAPDPEIFIHVRPEIMPLLRERYSTIRHEAHMWRMLLDPDRFQPQPSSDAARLTLSDLEPLRRLYADGAPTGEQPEFFTPEMLQHGVYYGIREGGALIAAAGTHLLVPEEGVGAIGNIYTRRDRRGRGLAARATSAVAADLLRLKLRTIGLNVNQTNSAALRVYERLGFARYCAYSEGVACRCD